jgi:glycosyltransferase involved in cell wall biosynthesis
MRVLWICSLPSAVQRVALKTEGLGAHATSWIVAHLPPPEGIDLHIACLWPGGTHRKAVTYGAATIHLVPCPRRGRALLFFQRDCSYFRPLFDELKPDVAHGWGTEDSFGLVARQLAPERHVIGIQGLITAYRARVRMETRTMLTALTERWTLRRAKWVVAESAYSLEAARPLCQRANLRVIEHPIRDEFLRGEQADGRAKKVLFLGMVSERKGISDALRAFSCVMKLGWTLHVIGSGTPAAESEMQSLARELGISECLRHDRNLSSEEIVKVMQSSSILLLPTRIDTGPTALKEALSLGLWPVCYDNTGPREYVRGFDFGSLARDLDCEDLARKVQDAVTAQPWLDAARRAELRAATATKFSRQSVWGNLESLYREILTNSES